MKKLIFLALAFCMVFIVQAEEKVTRLGQHPFYKSRDLQPADLKIIALDKSGDIKQGFAQAGCSDLVPAFLEQIQKVDIETLELNPGDTLQWMLFKKGRQVQVKKGVIWAGKKSMVAYRFTIFQDGRNYEFIVPKICGNISLKNVKDIPPPTCILTVEPSEILLGKSVRVSSCQSQYGVKTLVTVTDGAGAVIKTLELTPENCNIDIIMDKIGEYKLSAVVENQYAMKSPDGCEAAFTVIEPAPPAAPLPIEKVSSALPLSFLLEGGPGVVRGSYTGMVWARAGVLFKITPDKLDFIFSLGGGIPVYGDPWKMFFMGNALLNLHLGEAYLAGGLGFSTKEREERKGGIDLVGEVGFNLFHSNNSTGSIFGEFRAPVLTTDRPFDSHHKILLGFRYIF